jgi:hypothetical protein
MMCLFDMLDDWSTQIEEFVWHDVPPATAAPVTVTVNRRMKLERLRKQVVDLSKRIERKEEQAHFLAERVQVFLRVGDERNAYRTAMEIDRQREFIAAERRELDEARKAYQRTLAGLRRMCS